MHDPAEGPVEAEARFAVLGPLEVTVGGRPVHVGGPRAQATLAALLLADERIVPIDRLVDQVWGEDPPSSGRNQVMIAVSALRKALRNAGADPGLIETAESGYRLRAPAVDTRTVEANLARAREAEPAQAAALLRETSRLWRGQVLAGMDSPALRAAAVRWEELRLTVLEDWAELELELGRHRSLVGELGVFVAEHPLRERPRGQLMLALHRSGRQAEALEVYERGRAVLVDELGLEPGPALRAVRDAILRDEPSARRPEHRVRPAQLPPAVSAFSGRRRELALLDSLLDPPDNQHELPICVVYGVSGVGKTGLVVSWAHRMADRFPDGQLFVNLRGHDRDAPPLPPEAALAGFLRALGVPGERIPASVDERTALFRSEVAGRRMLIVLDNAASAAQVRPLLPGTAGCRVVITSLTQLTGLIAHHGARSIGLDVLTREEAVELLGRLAGAERVRAEQEAAHRLGELCDGLPLALRIVGARMMSRSSWTLAGLAGRLESERGRLDELRQEELEVRGSFALSYRNLPATAKLVFRRLGLLDLPGGFAPWVVAALAEVPLPVAEELCEQLVDRQLAQPLGDDAAGRPRYGFHDLIRLFSRERADAEEDAASRTAAVVRVASCLLGLIEQNRLREGRRPNGMIVLGDSPRLPLDAETVDRLLGGRPGWTEAERQNIVAVVDRCAALGQAGLAWELASMSVFLLERRAHYDDWRTMSETALAACHQAGDRLGTAAMELSLGSLYVHLRDLRAAAGPLARAAGQFEALGHPHGLGLALRYRASVDEARGDLRASYAAATRALTLLREVGDASAQALALMHISFVHLQADRPEQARLALTEAASVIDPAERRLRANILKRLAEVCLAQGRHEDARLACEEALLLVREIDDRLGEAFVQLALGECLKRTGDAVAAGTALAGALACARDLRDPLLEGRVLCAQERHGEAADLFADLGAWTWHAKAVAAMSGSRSPAE
ncbi:MAG: tetratricopeptide repeat protein [Nonomuraea sp.]|nr:tetratricopeptide repeat protein [Nonomuraea sp.]